MRRMRHTLGRLATAWWLLVCLCAPQLAALVPLEESGHACCRKKSTCCCRNRTGKASAIIGDRKDCARTCGLAAITAKQAAARPEPLPLDIPWAASVRTVHEIRSDAFGATLASVLHQRPPPIF